MVPSPPKTTAAEIPSILLIEADPGMSSGKFENTSNFSAKNFSANKLPNLAAAGRVG